MTTKLWQLQDELHIEVLRCLDIPSLKQARLVCRRWPEAGARSLFRRISFLRHISRSWLSFKGCKHNRVDLRREIILGLHTTRERIQGEFLRRFSVQVFQKLNSLLRWRSHILSLKGRRMQLNGDRASRDTRRSYESRMQYSNLAETWMP